ncbi:MAG: methylthioadenosine phosphorylase [Spirochaetes bacterium RBG_13_51_14]|nr:MAG: methylthioadenosine phosphorylase [Spirochaetes bacterium RBG_13_51_14]
MNKATIGVIGGSGLYEIEGAKTIEEISLDTPWGKPSDAIVIAEIEGHRAAFQPRHGRGHVHLPHEVNYRANIAALKMIGVREIIAFSAVGSLKEEIHPLDFVLPDQIIDRTRSRPSTFFGDGVAAHVSFANPFCSRLHGVIKPAADAVGLTMHTGQTLICMEGPAFSTKAESNLYRSWGAGVINMSTIPEAKLAREAEICYAVICMSTDYDCWHETEAAVTIELVIENLITNAGNAKKLLKLLLERLGRERGCECEKAAKNSMITVEHKRNKNQIKKLRTILPDYF